MKELLNKFRQLEISMSKDKGPFDLFALFLRENAPDKWDLVVAAEWIEQDKQASLKYMAEIIQRSLSKDDLLKLSRIVIIDENNPSLESLLDSFSVEHGNAEIHNSSFFGLDIKQAFLITAKRRVSNTQEA